MTKPGRPGEGKKYSARDIARIFGDVLPAQTKDDRPDGAAPGSGAASPVSGSDGDPAERWYRENRPPHHGG
ncbi:hypothetical protein [Tsukamurella strandjordii]|uniref:Uncharacterized protein n=1 Tax=Tsukamurella strandjordii TaxID=147577 RepID=A0AA90SGQ6_9ACTN|nr:hypothetical protein [Tsukamurella strandjordii]MDP0397959.1 hypothetical protein [Tsukamurella strandjordii]